VKKKLSLYARLEHAIRGKLNKWLIRLKDAEPGEVFLHQRRVYIVPTHPGLLFCVMLIAMFLGSVNYNLSLGFAFTFLIAGCALIDMHLTFRNIAHLHLKAGRAAPVFAGEEAQFELHLINRRRHDRYAIWLDFVNDDRPELASMMTAPSWRNLSTYRQMRPPASSFRRRRRIAAGCKRRACACRHAFRSDCCAPGATGTRMPKRWSIPARRMRHRPCPIPGWK
jgi:hypothetical protein